MLNEIPVEYFCSLDASGRRRDADERPELSKGSVEYVAPAEYMVRPPMPPVYMFVIDVSQAAAGCGMLSVVAATIKTCLDQLPGDERTLVGFLTFDRCAERRRGPAAAPAQAACWHRVHSAHCAGAPDASWR